MMPAPRAQHSGAGKPRVILLMQYYDPEPVYKGQKFAEAVVAAGFDVEVVTGFPNYPGGRVYDGYRIRLLSRSEVNGVRITRIPLYPSHDHGKLGRVLNYVSFFLSAFFYLTFAARRPKVIHAYLPPVTVGLAAAVAGFFRRVPVVVDIHDLWPDTLPATGMISNKRVLRVIDMACNWLYRRARHIILHSNGFRETLARRGVPESKMTTVIGWTHEAESLVQETPAAMAGLRGTKILYAGNIGRAQALGTVLEAARILQQQGQHERVTFCFLGSGLDLDHLKAKAASDALSNVAFLPRVAPEKVAAYLGAADCLLVHLKDDPLFAITLPSKTQAYMLAGKPILMGVRGEAANLISESGCGLVATPEDPQSIADAALAFADMSVAERDRMGQAGRDYYWRELSMAQGMRRFADVLRRAAGRSQP